MSGAHSSLKIKTTASTLISRPFYQLNNDHSSSLYKPNEDIHQQLLPPHVEIFNLCFGKCQEIFRVTFSYIRCAHGYHKYAGIISNEQGAFSLTSSDNIFAPYFSLFSVVIPKRQESVFYWLN